MRDVGVCGNQERVCKVQCCLCLSTSFCVSFGMCLCVFVCLCVYVIVCVSQLWNVDVLLNLKLGGPLATAIDSLWSHSRIQKPKAFNVREVVKKSKWKFKMAFAIRGPTPPPTLDK